MTFVFLYGFTLVTFLALDFFGLKYILRPVFDNHIPGLLLDDPRLVPAVAFYAFYVFCLMWFVSWPALQAGRPLLWVFASAALIGAMAYGTYEFTNWATLKGWHWRMVLTDLAWGTCLTGVSATLGVAVTRMLGLGTGN